MKLRTLMFASLLALTGAAFGATPPPAAGTGMGPMGHHEGPCKTNPQECKDAAAKFDQWCSANADKCTSLKAWAEKRREFCEANGEKCKERMQKMHEHMKEYCAKNPDDEHCKMMMNHKGDEGDMGGDMPPPPRI
jgi:hypothetical protein